MGKGPRRDIPAIAYFCAIAFLALLALAVPMRAFAASLDMPVPVAVVYPGQPVLEKGVEPKRFRVPADVLSNYALEEGQLKGRVARRTLLPGKPILLSDLKTPDIVEAGRATTIVYREGALVITSLGTPLRSAAEGEVVRVRNVDTGVVVSGVVTADGSVEVSAL